MVVLCNGMPRSGSTWSFNVIKPVLRHGYPGEEIQGGPSEAPIQFLKELSPGARHAVIKCHSLTPACRALARTRAVKVVFTTRDLGDAVASGVDAFRMSFERVLDLIGPSLELLSFHRSTGNAAIVC